MTEGTRSQRRGIRRAFLILVALLAVAAACVVARVAGQGAPAARVASAFFHALVAKDFNAAASLCEGAARDAVLRGEGLKEKLPDGEIVSEEYEARASGRVAAVRATVETAGPGGPGVGWFELRLASDGGEWKILSVTPSRPGIPGADGVPFVHAPGPRDVPAGAREAFSGYLHDLAAGRYREAARFLAGPALYAHAAAGPVLGKGPPFRETSEVEWEYLASGGKLLVARARYTVDGRAVSMVVTFYQMKDGTWRIVELNRT